MWNSLYRPGWAQSHRGPPASASLVLGLEAHTTMPALFFFEEGLWADDMPQWVKAFATKPDDLSLVLRTHMVQGENCLPQIVL